MEKTVEKREEKTFGGPQNLPCKRTSALSAFMFIQPLASGTSQQYCSVCKFNLWAITNNRRLSHRCDRSVCQYACPYGLIRILAKRKGMTAELWSRCPGPFTLVKTFLQLLMYDSLQTRMPNFSLLDHFHGFCAFVSFQRYVRYFFLSDSHSFCFPPV